MTGLNCTESSDGITTAGRKGAKRLGLRPVKQAGCLFCIMTGLSFIALNSALAATVPCISIKGEGDLETLTRLVLAEGISTACLEGRESEVFGSIAWGVMNRVLLSEHYPKLARQFGRGVQGVIFKPGQFNPAVSKRSRFAAYFTCPLKAPEASRLWPLALQAASQALNSPEKNPFVETAWEKEQGLSLVTHFYYPRSEQATVPPPAWASPKSKTLAKNLGPGCVQFFRVPKP